MRHLLLMCVVAACGGGGTIITPSETPSDDVSLIAGDWGGPVTLSGLATVNYYIAFTAAPTSTSVDVPLCPGATRPVTASLSGLSFGWEGEVTCGPMILASCREVLVTFTEFHGRLEPFRDVMSIRGLGRRVGCGVSSPFDMSLDATRSTVPHTPSR
jgi:hypothetical protein